MIVGNGRQREDYAGFSSNLFAGSTVLVTGGSAGIGKETAAGFLSCGAEVVIVGRDGGRLQGAVEDLYGRTGSAPTAVSCDVRDAAAVDALRERVMEDLGAVDVVVNNAAGNFRMAADSMTERAFRTVLDIDLVGTFNVTRAFLGDLCSSGHGVILSIVVPEADRGYPQFAHAGAAKAGIVSLTRTWAREWGPKGVRVVAIGPGPVPTEGVETNMSGVEAEAGGVSLLSLERVALGRLGRPADIAMAALFLCSPLASWITGVVLNVDGGLSVA